MIKQFYALLAVMQERANATQLGHSDADNKPTTTIKTNQTGSLQDFYFNEHGSIESTSFDNKGDEAVLTSNDHSLNNY